MVNKRPAIAATRQAYKTFGKEPNRYRPSSEALCRRMVKGLELYRTLTIIDLINMVSVASGHSIGGFDGDKIDGDTLTLGVGREGEPYEAIGRGQLNIAGMPVWRDKIGGVGTPTSDNDRTKLSEQTKHLVMIVNIYGDEMDLDGLIDFTMQLLEKYASAENIKFQIFTP
jgi:DNA/RNA-binding domain of Phe-tRNA-synthetase-like protein